MGRKLFTFLLCWLWRSTISFFSDSLKPLPFIWNVPNESAKKICERLISQTLERCIFWVWIKYWGLCLKVMTKNCPHVNSAFRWLQSLKLRVKTTALCPKEGKFWSNIFQCATFTWSRRSVKGNAPGHCCSVAMRLANFFSCLAH